MTKGKPKKPRQPPAVWLSREKTGGDREARYGIHHKAPQYLCEKFSEADRYFCSQDFHIMTHFSMRPGTKAKVRIRIERVP